MVTSRPTSEDQAIADFCTSTTPPSVTAERKVMMAISAIRVRPATERSGTMAVVRVRGGRCTSAGPVSVMKGEFSVAQQHAGKIEIVEQGQFVRGDDDRRAGPVEFGKEGNQPQGQGGIDVA